MPDTIKTLLVAIDPSSAGRAAFHQALRLAASTRARLIAISVTPQYEGNMNRWKIHEANEQLSKPFEQCLEEAKKIAVAQWQSVRIVHRTGNPAEEIVKVAEEESAGLVLLGYPKRAYLQRVLLGDTIAKVIGLSPCDVLLVPESSEVNFTRLLVGIDGSRYSMEAGQRALDLALAYGGEVHALTVIDVPVDRGLLYGVLDEARKKSLSFVQTLSGQGERFGVPVRVELREGSPYEEIVRYSEDKEIDLIVLGSYGKTALTRLLIGSVVERVASLSAKPTLVVKRLGPNGVRNPV